MHVDKTKDGVQRAPRLFDGSENRFYFRLGEGAGDLGAGAGREGDGREGLVREGAFGDGDTFRVGAGWPGVPVREGGVLGRVCCCSFRERLKSITR